jgi:hypothetical protein
MSDMKLSLIVEMIDHITAPFERLTHIVGAPAKAAGRAFAALSENLERVSNNFAGLATVVGAGFELRDVIRDQDMFARIGTDAGVGAERVKELQEKIDGVAQRVGVPLDELTSGFRKVFEDVGLEKAQADVDALATSMQRLGGHGEEIGSLFATLQHFGKLGAPEELTKAMAILREQTGSHADRIIDFARFAPGLFAGYQDQFGASGLDAVRDLGALFSSLRAVDPRPGRASSEVGELLDAIRKTDTAFLMQYTFHVPVLGRNDDEVRANYLADKRRPISEWLPKLLDASKSSNALLLGDAVSPELRDVLRKIDSADVTKALGAQGDVNQYLSEAARNAETTQSAFEKLRAAIHDVTEKSFNWPLKELTAFLSEFPTVAGAAVEAVGAFAIFGVASGWVMNLVNATRLLGTGVGEVAAAFRTAEAAAITAEAAAAGAEAAAGGAAASAAGLSGLGVGLTGLASILAPLAALGGVLGFANYAGNRIGPSNMAHRFRHDEEMRKWNLLFGGEVSGDEKGAPAPARNVRAERIREQHGATSSSTEVTVRFENAPKGLRVTTTRSDPNADVNLDLGYAMGVP